MGGDCPWWKVSGGGVNYPVGIDGGGELSSHETL